MEIFQCNPAVALITDPMHQSIITINDIRQDYAQNYSMKCIMYTNHTISLIHCDIVIPITKLYIPSLTHCDSWPIMTHLHNLTHRDSFRPNSLLCSVCLLTGPVSFVCGTLILLLCKITNLPS